MTSKSAWQRPRTSSTTWVKRPRPKKHTGDANETRGWRICSQLARALIAEARKLHADEPIVGDLRRTVYALDSTTIDLCLSIFPWATFRSTKAAIKIHTLLDLRGSIPSFVLITPGRVHDVNVIDTLVRLWGWGEC